jgi:hypothetical protein
LLNPKYIYCEEKMERGRGKPEELTDSRFQANSQKHFALEEEKG